MLYGGNERHGMIGGRNKIKNDYAGMDQTNWKIIIGIYLLFLDAIMGNTNKDSVNYFPLLVIP